MTEANATLRSRKKAITRQKVIDAARVLFTERDYHIVTIRELAKAFGMSTGAMFNSFKGKEQLFTEAMGFPPPVDGPLARAAPLLLDALIVLHNNPTGVMSPGGTVAFQMASHAIDLATSPLDGYAWARHLSSIRRDDPHTLAAGEPAASVPSDAAGDR